MRTVRSLLDGGRASSLSGEMCSGSGREWALRRSSCSLVRKTGGWQGEPMALPMYSGPGELKEPCGDLHQSSFQPRRLWPAVRSQQQAIQHLPAIYTPG